MRIGLFLLLLLIGCDSRNSRSLAEEIKDMRFAMREMQALEDRLITVEQEVKSLQDMLSRSKMAEPPLTRTTLISDGSHLDDPYLGNADSKVVVMAFTDYQCTPCRRFYFTSFPRIKEQYLDTKKIKFILRDYPLRSHEHARRAATVAHCAGEQGKYWEISKALFERSRLVDEGNFESLLPEVSGLKLDKLNSCLESKRYEKEITLDTKAALRLGAKGAPGFFIGIESHENSFKGVFIRGAQPFKVLSTEIERHLTEAEL